jgi:ribA/ribD-fused uncharacterized protein
MQPRTRPSFIGVEPKVPWTKEQTEQRINETMARIADESRLLLFLDRQINNINDQKLMLRERISRGNKYLNQLKKQLDSNYMSDSNKNAENIAKVSFYDDKNIKGFFGMYRFLSNFHEAPILYEGDVYPSTEAAYQAAKTFIMSEREMFFNIAPSKAKRLGQQLTMRGDWEDIKTNVMYEVCLFKFSHHNDLRKELLATSDRYLEEANWWGDKFWGTCEGEGRNELGVILMMIRYQLNRVEKFK